MDTPSNAGNGAHAEQHYTQLVLTLDIVPKWHLHIGGNIENADVALAVLHQAVRYFESQLRAQSALQLQQQLAEQARTAGIVNKVLGKG